MKMNPRPIFPVGTVVARKDNAVTFTFPSEEDAGFFLSWFAEALEAIKAGLDVTIGPAVKPTDRAPEVN